MLEHLEQRLKEQFEVGVGEAGFLGEGGRDIAFGGVEGVGNNVLSALNAGLRRNRFRNLLLRRRLSVFALRLVRAAQTLIATSSGVMGWND